MPISKISQASCLILATTAFAGCGSSQADSAAEVGVEESAVGEPGCKTPASFQVVAWHDIIGASIRFDPPYGQAGCPKTAIGKVTMPNDGKNRFVQYLARLQLPGAIHNAADCTGTVLRVAFYNDADKTQLFAGTRTAVWNPATQTCSNPPDLVSARGRKLGPGVKVLMTGNVTSAKGDTQQVVMQILDTGPDIR